MPPAPPAASIFSRCPHAPALCSPACTPLAPLQLSRLQLEHGHRRGQTPGKHHQPVWADRLLVLQRLVRPLQGRRRTRGARRDGHRVALRPRVQVQEQSRRLHRPAFPRFRLRAPADVLEPQRHAEASRVRGILQRPRQRQRQRRVVLPRLDILCRGRAFCRLDARGVRSPSPPTHTLPTPHVRLPNPHAAPSPPLARPRL